MAEAYTQILEWEAIEVKAWLEKCRHDFPLFCEKFLGVNLHDGQLMAWREIKKAGYRPVYLFLCGNRAGKTMFLSCFHIWHLFYKHYGPGRGIDKDAFMEHKYKTANLAPHSELTKIIYNNILNLCRGTYPLQESKSDKHGNRKILNNRSILRWFVDQDGLNNPIQAPKSGPYEIFFANNSKFSAHTTGGANADSVQGMAFGLISYDECGRSAHLRSEREDLQPRIGEVLGKIFFITTPDEGNPDASMELLAMSEEANKPNSFIKKINWSSAENVYLGEEGLAVMTAGMSEDKKRQVLEGALIKAAKRFFPAVKVNRIFENRSQASYIDFSTKFPDANRRYSMGVDTAGLGRDAWSIYVVDTTKFPYQIVYAFADKDSAPSENIHLTRDLVTKFQQYCGAGFKWTMDATSEGGTIVQDNLSDLDPIAFKFGIEKGTGRNMKVELMDNLRRLIHEEKIISVSDFNLMHQLTMYRGPKDDQKNTTDRIMALGMAVYEDYKQSLQGPGEMQQVFDMGDLWDQGYI